jgi:hypothetical protein
VAQDPHWAHWDQNCERTLWVHFKKYPVGTLVGTFQKNPPHTCWVTTRRIVSGLTKNSQWTHWVNSPLPPVKGKVGHEVRNQRPIVVEDAGLNCVLPGKLLVVALWSTRTGPTVPTSAGQEACYHPLSTSNTRLSRRADGEDKSVEGPSLADEENRGVGEW